MSKTRFIISAMENLFEYLDAEREAVFQTAEEPFGSPTIATPPLTDDLMRQISTVRLPSEIWDLTQEEDLTAAEDDSITYETSPPPED